MNELDKTMNDIELTIMDGLFNYLKENKYFEKKYKAMQPIDYWNDIMPWIDDSLLEEKLHERKDGKLMMFYGKENLVSWVKGNYKIDDLYDENELAEDLENKGWKTLNPNEYLKPNDFFDDDEIEEYVKDNYYPTQIWTDSELLEDINDYYVFSEEDDIVEWVKDNVNLEDLVEYR